MRSLGRPIFSFQNSKASSSSGYTVTERRSGSKPIHSGLVKNSHAQVMFFFEIIADGEVAEHFEERMVTARFADILDIIRADTFLRVRNPRIVRLDTSVKISFKRRHTRIDPQQEKDRYAARAMRSARFYGLCLQKMQAIWNGFHWLSYWMPPSNYNGPLRIRGTCFKIKQKTPLNNQGRYISRYHPGYRLNRITMLPDQQTIALLRRNNGRSRRI